MLERPALTRASALLFGSTAFAALATRGVAQAMEPIRVIVTPVEIACEVYYAIEMGFFAKAGLDVAVQVAGNNPAVAAAVSAGAADVGHGAIDTLAAVHVKGIPVTVLAPSGEFASPAMDRFTGIAVPANSGVQQAKDLNGKLAGVASLHGLTETALRVWIDQNGGDSSTLRYVEVPFPSMAVALVSNRVDVVSTAEPFISAVGKAGRFLSYGLEGIGKRFVLAGWFATPTWAKARPDLAGRFASVIRETAIWANKNPAKTAEIIAKYTKLDSAVIATLTRARYAETMSPQLLQPLIDASAKYNNFASFPAQDLIYTARR